MYLTTPTVVASVLTASSMARELPCFYAVAFADMLASLDHDIDACVDQCSLLDSEVHAADVVERLVSRERLVQYGVFGLGMTESQVAAVVADALLGPA